MGDWISVEDRLPDPGDLVLVYTPPQRGDWPDSLRIGFDYIDEDGESWYEHSENYEHFCCVAQGGQGPSEEAPYSHWMPLPAPPEPHQGRGGGDA